MTFLLCPLLVVSTILSLSSPSPVPDNVGFMNTGGEIWLGRPWAGRVEDRDRYGLQSQERVRRQQRPGRPVRKVQQGGQVRPGNRPNRQPRPQPQERYYQAPNNRPLNPVKKQPAPVEKAYEPEPVVERVLQAYEAVERDTQRVDQKPSMEQMYNDVEAQKPYMKQMYNEVEAQKPSVQQVYNEVDRSYNTRPQPSTVYERSATAPVQDSLESESYAAPAEQRDLEAAVAAGAAGYTGESYAEPQRLSFQIHGQEGPNSYKYGYDTGVGYNRQFKYEERDNYGVTHGRYGYYDQEGKLQVVNYTSDAGGFHAEGEHVPKPEY